MKTKFIFIFSLIVIFSNAVLAQNEPPTTTGKNPLIVIPGVMGSTLVNPETNETVWIKLGESKTEDIRLPISTNFAANKDKLVAGEIIEEVKIVKFLPGLSVYGDLLKYLDKKAGYRRITWDSATKEDTQDVYLTFPYDWRRDNVENARLLIQKIEKLKIKLGKPNLKVDILAHSMGGLIARYAAMYGNQDLQNKPNPTWAGTKHIQKIIMLGTPNEGAMNALDTFYNGYSVQTPAGRYYPSFLNRAVAFTIPALYELLPHGESAQFFDEDLNRKDISIYQVDNWEKYGWSYLEDEKLTKGMTKNKRQQAEKFLEAVLYRTQKFHDALDVKTKIPANIQLYAFGSDCKSTLDGAIIYHDDDKNTWKTLTRSDSFKNSKGEKISSKSVEEKIFGIGDGTVPFHSFLAETISQLNGQNLFSFDLFPNNKKIVCESHVSLPNNSVVQENFMAVFNGTLKPSNDKILAN
jgi:pimeloyl-ACP methyl ester carboxylesterase